MILLRHVLLAATLLFATQASAQAVPRIAIIIDDLGYHLEAGRRAINLPGPIAYAILPGTPRGRSLAETAHAMGKEVLLHLPLQAVERDGVEEPGSVTLDMSHRKFQRTFATAINSVPFAIGVSSHRGSLLTRHPGHMEWLMAEIRARDGLFFVDSFTTSESVAMQLAAEVGVAAVRRDIFLDNDRTPDALAVEFQRLLKLARQQGIAVAIGHPYPETLEFLEQKLQELEDDGVELMPVSEIMHGLVRYVPVTASDATGKGK